MASGNRSTRDVLAPYHQWAELLWPLAERQHASAMVMVQQIGAPRRQQRRLASRLLPPGATPSLVDERVLQVPLEVEKIGPPPAVGAAGVLRQKPSSRIVVCAQLLRIRLEQGWQRRRVGYVLQPRRAKRPAVGRGRSMTLKECDSKVVAVVVAIGGVQRVLRGSASYFNDSTLGNCLRIKLDDADSAGVELLLRESEWSGQIKPDNAYGCDVVVYLDQHRCPS